jgi:xanthosine utilization system XapX-like protein
MIYLLAFLAWLIVGLFYSLICVREAGVLRSSLKEISCVAFLIACFITALAWPVALFHDLRRVT